MSLPRTGCQLRECARPMLICNAKYSQVSQTLWTPMISEISMQRWGKSLFTKLQIIATDDAWAW